MSESYGGVGGDSQTGRKPSIAARAREIADRIDKLPDQVQEAFTCGKPRESRVRDIKSLVLEIRHDMSPVVNFIERRRPAETARLFLGRIEYFLTAAEACASLDIPEWTSGVEPTVPPRENLARAGILTVLAIKNSESIRGWADDIESEEPASKAESETECKATHSEDFTSVVWFGTRYPFSKGNQARAVRLLWKAWESDGHSLMQETIGEAIESSADRFELAKTFRARKLGGGYKPHPAWGTMIQQDSKGSYRLVPPESA